MSKSRGNVVVAVGGARHARRRRVPLVLLHLEAAVGRLPLLDRDGRRERAPVHAHALEHLRLLRPLRERERRRRAAPSASRPTSTAGSCSRLHGHGRDRDRAAGRLRHDHAPAARSRRSSTTSRTGTCGARGGASGTATRPPSRRCASASSTVGEAARAAHAVRGRRDLREPRRLRAVGAPVRLPRAAASRDEELEWADGGRARRGRARAHGARAGQDEGAPAAARGGRRGRPTASARRSSASSELVLRRAEREGACASSPRPRSSAAGS